MSAFFHAPRTENVRPACRTGRRGRRLRPHTTDWLRLIDENTEVAGIFSTAVSSIMLSFCHHLTHFIAEKAGSGSFKTSPSVLIRSVYWKLLRWIGLFRFFDLKKLAKEISVLLFKWAKIELIRVTFIFWSNLCWGY